jgi:diguanylate cyclase (GGDEF)-like protein
MRLATITNWAYGVTVALTLVSGAAMLVTSRAAEQERAAVEQRVRLDGLTETLDQEVFALTDHARQALDTGDATYRVLYQREVREADRLEARLRRLHDAGASEIELNALKSAITWADALRDEQQMALKLHDSGDIASARRLLFGAEYEREMDRVRVALARFRDRLDTRVEAQVADSTRIARTWQGISQAVLAITGLLFLAVLYFVFKRRVLHPVVSLSDVVTRLAAQDWAAEPPQLDQIDEIGDMAQAVRVFRENGLERQRLEEERAADRAMRDLLSRMTQRLQGCNTLHDLTGVVTRFVPEIAPGLAGRLYLLDTERNAVVEVCHWSGPAHSRSEFAPTACWALRRGLPHRPAGASVDVPCDHLDLSDGGVPDSLCLPLTAQRETIGLLYLEAATRPIDAFPAAGEDLQMLAETIGLALANLRLREKLREMAMVDPLTGLANRRRLEVCLEELTAGAARTGRPLACLMIDVDHFKRFNDAFGHDAGDLVLREVGAVLRHATREHGNAFRYGGEEFLLLLPGLTAEQARVRGEEIRTRIAALRLRNDSVELGALTASIGVAAAPEQCPLDRLVVTADAAVLRAKTEGRDRVVVATVREADAAAA